MAQTGKPTIMSTAGLSIYDIDNLVSFSRHKGLEFGIMHCVALYPTPLENIQMNFLDKLIKRYPDVPIGYSGHEAPDELDPIRVAVSKGATIFERHVGVPTEEITLNAYSMSPGEVEAWVQSAQSASAICGEGCERKVSQAEVDSLCSLMRGAYASKTIKAGETLDASKVFFAMPCEEHQLTSGDIGSKRSSFSASGDYARGEPIHEEPTLDPVVMVRGIIHDAKGMIYEAGVPLGSDVEIELSHHYGIEHFRSTGAVIVSVVNREYCKKIIVLLPGQSNPTHRHDLKEETFHVLSGDLCVNLNGIDVNLGRGGKLLVERGAWHNFSSKLGCVFEEISTTHSRGDSYYEDERIAALDPMQRKTIIDAW